MSTEITEELLGQIEQELGEDGVYVAPALRTQVPEAAEARIEAAVAQAPSPTYVVLVQVDHGGSLARDLDDLAGLIRDDTGRQGTYVGMGPEYAGPHLEIKAFPDDVGLYRAARISQLEHPDDLEAQTLLTLELLREGGDLDARLEQAEEDNPEGAREITGTGADDSGLSFGVGGVELAVGTGLLALVVAGVVLLRRRSAGRARTGRSFTLPPAVLSTVRAAEDERNERQAERRVQELGEAVDAAEIRSDRPRGHAAWQAALDHYDVARRILDRRHSPADVVGALVLAERGHDALAAALAGRTWTPTTPCYFNPLHPAAGTRAKAVWTDADGRRVKVPACAACRQALEQGREPDDVLDFVSDGVPRHYFTLDLGVWSSTGYGALAPDLLGHLLRG